MIENYGSVRVRSAFAAALLACATMLALARPTLAQQTDMQNCEQEDSSPIAVRACSVVLAAPGLSASETVRVYTRRGRAWMMDEEPAAAEEDFTHVLAVEPKNAEALQGRASALTALAKHAAAVEDWTRMIDLYPAHDEYYRNRGASYLAAGKHPEALEDYTQSLKINPKGVEAFIGRASVYEAMKDREKTLKEFELAIAVEPNFLPIYWARAETAERWGEKDVAIQNYVQVLRINGVYAHARKALVRLGVDTPP